MRDLKILTPEGVTFRLPLASPVTRMVALSVDLLVILAAFVGILQFIAPLSLIAKDAYLAFTGILLFVLSLFYPMVTEVLWRGQTLGKRIMHLRVVDAQGMRLETSQIVVRNLMRFVDGLPLLYLLGGAVSLLHRHGQRLGDIAAATVVIRITEATAPNLDQALGSKFNSLAVYGHLAARLRQRIPAQIASIAMEALLRREGLEPTARLALFEELANYFRQQVHFPPEATEQLGNEQYVRNVTEILFRTERKS